MTTTTMKPRPCCSPAMLSAAALLVVAALLAPVVSGLCCLCDDCFSTAGGRASLLVTSTGDTCNSIMLKMAKTSGGTCSGYKSQHYNACCNPNFNPPQIAQQARDSRTSSDSKEAVRPMGNEPECDLCEDGSFPGTPNTVTAVLYLTGNPTCEDLYWMGKRSM